LSLKQVPWDLGPEVRGDESPAAPTGTTRRQSCPLLARQEGGRRL